MFDYVIRGGKVVDGTGSPAVQQDVAIQDGRIAAVGNLFDAAAHEVIDATGKIVTPGFVDIHTHYDGQVTWDDTVDPSFSHGITTIVMGNCGVGFAPVRRGEEIKLIELMEGVEDIPGTALSEGMDWSWESFPEYLDALATRRWTVDVAAQVPHGPLRAYVMGDRGHRNEDATPDDIAQMATLVREAVDAGAVGFTTSRLLFHTSLSGEPVPGTWAGEDELFGIGCALKGRQVVIEVIPGGIAGGEPFSHQLDGFNEDGTRRPIEPALARELDWMARLSKESGLPITFLFGQNAVLHDKHVEALAFTDAANADGAKLYPQVNPRPVGLISSFQMYHIFLRRSTYLALAHLPFAARVAELRKPEVRAAILSEQDVPPEVENFNNNLHHFLHDVLKDTFPMGNPLDFEPTADRTVVAAAAALGVSTEEHVYDLMLEDDGRAMLFTALNGYLDRNLDVIRSLITRPGVVVGGSDGGAHVRFICDAALPTYALVHWVRDRSRGERIGLEDMVHKLTQEPATLYAFDDRGVIAPGKRADINVIDMARLHLEPPEPSYDLPANGLRLLQRSRGYAATFVNGVLTRRDDCDTGARPGRLLRGKSVVGAQPKFREAVTA